MLWTESAEGAGYASKACAPSKRRTPFMLPAGRRMPRCVSGERRSKDGSNGLYTGDGSVDSKGNSVLKSNTGNWRACPFILGTECCERLAYYGIATNLVSYLTKKLHEGNVPAARNVTTWQGTCYLTPLIGAVLADAYWGRYWTIAAFSTLYFIVIS
ncbi:hypothetical protein OROMI_009800 [Orobanche minor]